MDPLAEEQLDYGDEEYGSQKMQYQGGGAISALTDEELMGEDDEYDDLYNDVNVGEGFMQMHQSETQVPSAGVGNGGHPKTEGAGSRVSESGPSRGVNLKLDGRGSTNSGSSFPQQNTGGLNSNKGPEEGTGDYSNGSAPKGRGMEIVKAPQVGNMGFQGSATAPPKFGADPNQMPVKFSGATPLLPDPGIDALRNAQQMQVNRVPGNVNRPIVSDNPIRPAVDNGTTMIFVGDLHWWTTDAELEGVLSQYGRVKEIKFFDERASGKSKGYCQVEFYESSAAAACKEGMHGFLFNGRACVVAFASPQSLKQMGAAYLNKAQVQAQAQPQGRRVPSDGGGGRGAGANFPAGAGDTGGRNFNKVGWGRGGQGILNGRGQTGGMMRGRGAIGAKNMMSTGGVGPGAAIGANPYAQGMGGPDLGGPAGGMMHPQNMMGAGFDPTFMGRGGGYGGFGGPAFPGMMPQYPGMNPMGLPGVAPHVNPAFFGRGMSTNGMGMMGSTGMEAHHPGMWGNAVMMGGYGGGEEQGRRTRESSYGGDDGASDYGYGDASQERVAKPTPAPRERERVPEREFSERRHHDEREQDWDRSDRDRRYREEKDGHRDHRLRERDWDNEEDWDRGQSSSRSRSKTHMMQEDDHRSRSRDGDYGKRRRLPSE